MRGMMRLALLGVPGAQEGEAAYTLKSPPAIAVVTSEVNVVQNGDFANWTDDNPDDFTVSGESGDNEISQVGPGEGHGGAGTGLANFYTTEALIQLRQACLESGTWYKIMVDVDKRTTGYVRIYAGTVATGYDSPGLVATGTHTYIRRSGGTGLNISRLSGETDVTIDNLRAYVMSNLYSVAHAHQAALSANYVAMTIADDTQAGVWQRHAASGDQVHAYFDRVDNHVYLEKIVGGVTTRIARVATAYVDGKALMLEHPAKNQWVVYYDTLMNLANGTATAIIDDNTLTDANLNACDRDGYFASSEDTVFASYRWGPLFRSSLSVVSTLTLYAEADSHVENLGDQGYDPANADGTANWLAWIDLANNSNCDAALCLGDQAQFGVNVAEAGGYVSTIDNVLCALGNHDLMSSTQTANEMKALAVAAYGMDAEYYARTIGFCRILVLDSNHDADGIDAAANPGNLTDAQMTWLAGELAGSASLYLVCLHHPITTYLALDRKSQLEELMLGRDNVYILSGHRHPDNNVIEFVGGCPHVTLSPTVKAKYSVVTLERMSNGSARVTVDEQTVTP